MADKTDIQSAFLFHSLRQQIFISAIRALNLSAASHGLDAGCGIGLQAMLLAEHVGTDGQVTGLDIAADQLRAAQEISDQAGLGERMTFQEGDIRNLPFDEHTFDWAWSVDCVGYAPLEPLPLIKELVRVVKPGGTIAILAWSSESLLPGYPLLEARLKGTAAGTAPFSKERPPEQHFLRATGWFRAAGLQEVKAHSFVADVHAPLSGDQRRALAALLAMRWLGVQAELTPVDWAEFQRLCRPDSADFIVDHPDYHAFFTYTMFHGKVGRNGIPSNKE